MGKIIAISTQKGGVGKTTTAANLGRGLARQGGRVLLVDADPQYSLSLSLGIVEPNNLTVTLATMMERIINDVALDPLAGIVHHSEGVDILPSNTTLTNMELSLAPIIGRETILREYVEMVRHLYDWIIIDTQPSANLLTVNALAAADSVIIPVVPKYLDAKGLEQLLKTISKIRRQINPNLKIDGILLTIVDKRAKLTREIITLIRDAYSSKIHIFSGHIPRSIRAAEASAEGKSIFAYDPNGKVAAAYETLASELVERSGTKGVVNIA